MCPLPGWNRAGYSAMCWAGPVWPARSRCWRPPPARCCWCLTKSFCCPGPTYEQLLLSDGSPAHQRVLQNLVRTISDKYFLLSRRVDLLVLKSLRAKVCAYLLNESERAGSLTFSIPFSRVQLADYLNCDRSALSRELSLMQKDGLLDTFKSSFKLLDPDALKQMVQ